jgi:hypothetical protein
VEGCACAARCITRLSAARQQQQQQQWQAWQPHSCLCHTPQGLQRWDASILARGPDTCTSVLYLPAPPACFCRVFERDGVQVVCDTVSMDFLKGAVVEFEDSLMRSAFQVGWVSRGKSCSLALGCAQSSRCAPSRGAHMLPATAGTRFISRPDYQGYVASSLATSPAV